MTTKSFATPQDVKDKIGFTDDTTDDVELQKYLEQGHRTLELRVGREFTQEKIVNRLDADRNVPREHDFDIRPVLQVNGVFIDSVEISEDDYEVDKQLGTITFSESFRDEKMRVGSSIVLEYVPKVYKDLEVWYAVLHLLAGSVVQVDDDQVKSQKAEAEQMAAKLESYINRNISVGYVSDGRVRRGFR